MPLSQQAQTGIWNEIKDTIKSLGGFPLKGTPEFNDFFKSRGVELEDGEPILERVLRQVCMHS
jgi:hypothetical protein